MKKVRQFTLLFALLCLILAIFLFWKPVETLKTIVIICAVLAIFKGIVEILSYFRSKNKKEQSILELISGIVILILGVFLIFAPGFGVAFIGTLFAIWFIIEVFTNIAGLSAFKKNKNAWYWVALIFNIICAILAIMLLFRPFYAAMSLTILLGFFFLSQAIALIVAYIGLRTLKKEAE